MGSAILYVINALFVLALVASGWLWLGPIRKRLSAQLPVTEPQDRPAAPWSLSEFFLCFGLWLLCSVSLNVTVQKHWGTGEEPRNLEEGVAAMTNLPPEGMIAMSWGSVLVVVLVIACLLTYLGLHHRGALIAFGLWPNRSDIRLGLLASLALIPPVMLLSTVLSSLVKYEHPVFDTLSSQSSLLLFISMFVGVVFVTPVFEEFMFRGLFQGGLEKLTRLWNYRDEDPPPLVHTIRRDEVLRWSWMPVIVSSVVFAMMHFGQGLAPVPLFFFSLGLGYLYRQTGRLWPCVVAHAILNLIGMLGFWLGSNSGT
jgi:membrane protease YdiL (CAAX protease family)